MRSARVERRARAHLVWRGRLFTATRATAALIHQLLVLVGVDDWRVVYVEGGGGGNGLWRKGKRDAAVAGGNSVTTSALDARVQEQGVFEGDVDVAAGVDGCIGA